MSSDLISIRSYFLKERIHNITVNSGAQTVIKAASKLFITCKVRSQVCSVSRY